MSNRTGSVAVVAGSKGDESLLVRITSVTKVGPVTCQYILRTTEEGYQLDKDDGKFSEPYMVNYRFDRCTCPDYRNRSGLCKHCKALAALWTAGKIN